MRMRAHRCYLLAAILTLFAGCSGDRKPPAAIPQPGSEAANTVGQTREQADAGPLRIEPPNVYKGTTVRALLDPGLPAAVRYEWLVRGEPVQSGADSSMETARFRKGDSIQVRAVTDGRTIASQPVTIMNSPPGIREIRFVPGASLQSGALGVEADVVDADGDETRVEIAWRKNGEPAGNGSRLGVPVKRGDKIEVTITPFDGEGPGKSATLAREIRNIPPVIEGQEQFQVAGNVVTFHVRASDPDGDPLAFALKEAPAGMQIDRATGWVRWETARGTTGKVPFTVLVSDGSGGESTARFTVTIAEEPPQVKR